jgi:AcrR family transcriptional regulator
VSKGAETRERILDRAFRLATRDGLEGLSIGGLANELNMSKSGLFAHFGSKEDLQVEVLKLGAERFKDEVIRPAFRAPRGVRRLRAFFEGWMRWLTDPRMPGGCIFQAAATELDDQEGRTRDYLVGAQKEFRAMIGQMVRLCIETGEFRADVDTQQFAFDLYGIVLAYGHSKRLLRETSADARAHHAFDRLVRDARISPPK